MKLCWNNIENIRLNSKGNFYRINVENKIYGSIIYLKDSCKICGEEFFGNKLSIFCSKSCANSNTHKNRKFSEEHRRKISETRIKNKLAAGKNNPMYGKRGKDSPWYGKKRIHSDETKKKISDNHADVSGENNPNWQGGTAHGSYCSAFYDEEYKQDIRDRDHSMCWSCGVTAKQLNRNLDVHHIDYDKQNCMPINLISLCPYCHRITNGSREWHTEWYQRIMVKRFNNR